MNHGGSIEDKVTLLESEKSARDENLKRLIVFSVINLVFFFIELLVGFLSNSVAIVADALHVICDCFSFVLSIFGILQAKSSKRRRGFSYGNERFELVTAFLNSVLLCYLGLSLVYEGIENILKPHLLSHKGEMLFVAVCSFTMNMFGTFYIGHDHDHDHDDTGHKENMQSVIFHLLADLAGSLSVLVCIFLIKFFNINKADGFASVFLGFCIFAAVIPLFRSTFSILMQGLTHKQDEMRKAVLQQIKEMSDVVVVSSSHMWQLSASHIVASLHVRCHPDADYEICYDKISALCSAFVNELYLQIDIDM
ncbi:hypothetical protein PCE1_004216 [Barthelona sp. PCE]